MSIFHKAERSEKNCWEIPKRNSSSVRIDDHRAIRDEASLSWKHQSWGKTTGSNRRKPTDMTDRINRRVRKSKPAFIVQRVPTIQVTQPALVPHWVMPPLEIRESGLAKLQ